MKRRTFLASLVAIATGLLHRTSFGQPCSLANIAEEKEKPFTQAPCEQCGSPTTRITQTATPAGDGKYILGPRRVICQQCHANEQEVLASEAAQAEPGRGKPVDSGDDIVSPNDPEVRRLHEAILRLPTGLPNHPELMRVREEMLSLFDRL